MSNETLTVLESRLMDVAGHLSATEYQLITLLDEFDQRGGWHGDGIRSFSHWLNWKLGLSALVAREKVRVARALRDLPLTRDAFGRGHISYSKVRAMTRVATPANESRLLVIAEHGTAAHMERLCRQYRKIRRPDDEASASAWKPGRSCTWFLSDDDTMEIRVRLPVEDAEVVIAAIQKVADQIYEDAAAEKNVSAETPVELPPEVEERRADALTCMAERVVSHDGAAVESTPAPIRDVVIHLNADTNDPEYQVSGEPFAYNGRFDAINPDTLRRLTCDCRTTPVLKGKQGRVLDIGRRSRVVPPALRLALSVRDHGCRFPGCTQHRWTDAHHVRHWIDGGETSLDNLITLCRYHYRALHKGEFSIEKTAGAFEFRSHTGKVLRDECNEFANTRPITIPSEPNISRWAGEQLDMDLALVGLDFADQKARESAILPASQNRS